MSFCFRALRMKRPDEYFAYDPRPVMLRNRDVVGGLNKRRMSVGAFFGHYIDFIHRIIGRYHPLRVMLLYPFYILLTYFMTVGTIWRHSRKYRGFLPNVARRCSCWWSCRSTSRRRGIRLFAPPGVTGKVGAARLQPVPTKAIADETSP